MASTRARIAVRKMGTRRGAPHYGAECVTCGTVLAVAHLERADALALGEAHRLEGCRVTMRWAANGGR